MTAAESAAEWHWSQMSLGLMALCDLQTHGDCTVCKEAKHDTQTNIAMVLRTEKSKQRLVQATALRQSFKPNLRNDNTGAYPNISTWCFTYSLGSSDCNEKV